MLGVVYLKVHIEAILGSIEAILGSIEVMLGIWSSKIYIEVMLGI
jgi:hypothetical protein